ncbi:MAG: ABC transporter substrate-binding protein [Oscillospiraceae bacterium]|jgi:peptide/nickel transport system substrate-binding protein|nr:ABC transporter substrate-binding protein [Oscillospiraceae bacterium]
MKKRITAFLLTAVMLLGALAGCGGPANNSGDGSGDGGNGGDNTSRSLKIRKVNSLASTDYDVVTYTEDMSILSDNVFQGLYGMDEAGGGYCKLLAKDVAISEDGITYTITLVDATFQNGDAVKASDVKFSYDRAMATERFNYVTDMIDSVEVQDDKTVVFTLKYPYSAIDHTFFSIKITSEREITEAGASYGTTAHTAATGPYAISKYDPAGGLTLTAYDGYWGGAPAIKTVEYVLITEDSAAVIAYENGEIDFMNNAPTSDWEALVSASGDNNAVLKGNSIRTLYINYQSTTNNSILANDLVRQAICYAVDKNAINTVATSGLGTTSDEYILSDYVATAPEAKDFETYSYNPEKAKELLLQAGYTEADLAAGVSVGTLTTYGPATGEKAKAAQVVQANLKAVGLLCEIDVADSNINVPKLKAHDFDLGIYGDSGNYDFNNIRQQVLVDGGYCIVDLTGNPGELDYSKVESLLADGIAETDIAARKAIYTELWSMVADTATMHPYMNMPVAVVWSSALNPGDGAQSPTYYHLNTFSWK